MPRWTLVTNQDGSILTYFDDPLKIEDLTKSKNVCGKLLQKTSCIILVKKLFGVRWTLNWSLLPSRESNFFTEQQCWYVYSEFLTLLNCVLHNPVSPWLCRSLLWESVMGRLLRFWGQVAYLYAKHIKLEAGTDKRGYCLTVLQWISCRQLVTWQHAHLHEVTPRAPLPVDLVAIEDCGKKTCPLWSE